MVLCTVLRFQNLNVQQLQASMQTSEEDAPPSRPRHVSANSRSGAILAQVKDIALESVNCPEMYGGKLINAIRAHKSFDTSNKSMVYELVKQLRSTPRVQSAANKARREAAREDAHGISGRLGPSNVCSLSFSQRK